MNSGNLINHWSMNWSQFKDSMSHMVLTGAVVASWSLNKRWQVWTLYCNDKYFCHWIRFLGKLNYSIRPFRNRPSQVSKFEQFCLGQGLGRASHVGRGQGWGRRLEACSNLFTWNQTDWQNDWQTERTKNITFLQLCWRTVKETAVSILLGV